MTAMQASRTGKLAGPTLKWISAAKRSRKVVLHRSSIELWWSSRNSQSLIWSCDLAAQRALQWLHWLPASCRALQTLIRLHRSSSASCRKKPCWDALKTNPLFHRVLNVFYLTLPRCFAATSLLRYGTLSLTPQIARPMLDYLTGIKVPAS